MAVVPKARELPQIIESRSLNCEMPAILVVEGGGGGRQGRR